MSGEYSIGYESGLTVYAVTFDPSDGTRAWNGSAFVTLAGNRPDCAVPMTDEGGDLYTGQIPATAPAGDYFVQAFLQGGGSPADSDPVIGFSAGVSWPGSGNVPTFTTDPDFLEALIHRVALQVDANANAAVTGAHAGVTPNWQPVAGYSSIQCLVELNRASPVEGEGRPGSTTSGRVLFAQSVVADRRHRLVWTEPNRGTMHLYLMGQVWNEDGMSHHWCVDIADRPI